MTQDPDITDLQRKAAAWMLRLTPGRATPQDVAAFKAWCRENPAHIRAFKDIQSLWEAGPVGQRILGANPLDAYLAQQNRRAMLPRRAFLGGALAASAAGYAVIVRPPLNLWPSLSEWTADYRTATGERRQISLANGISIDMNTQTSIGLRPKAEDADRIELIAGEGLVTAGRHPLEIVAASGILRAVDTTFNVRRDADRVSVMCLDGEVQIACAAGSARVGTGRQAIYSGTQLEAAAETDPVSVTSWREGFLVFHRTPLTEVVDEINRYRRGRIIVANAELGQSPISGRFYLTRLDEIVEKLQNAFSARVTSLPGGVIILS